MSGSASHDLDFVQAQVETPFRNYLKSSSDLLRGLAPSLGLSQAQAFSDEELDILVEHAFHRYVEQAGLFGTPEGCRSRLEAIQAIGVDEIGCLIDFGIPTDVVLESLHHLDQLRQQVQSGPRYDLTSNLLSHSVTHLQCTISLAQMLILDEAAFDALAQVQHLLLGGEALPQGLAQALLERRAAQGTPGPLLNMYGPTEATIWATTHRVEADDLGAPIPIGTPIAGTYAYVLDSHQQLCPIGVPGELYLGGDGVVPGYHERPERDAERFVPDPFRPGRRLYRTGDRAFARQDGSFSFLGRTDHQVKLRGHRIELGEVEAALEALPSVDRAAARIFGDGFADQRLIAYVILAQAAELPSAQVQSQLRRALTELLPAAMIPAQILVLNALPHTPNGKLDRSALPSPQPTAGGDGQPTQLTPPRNDLERGIAKLWAEALGVSNVGRDQSFFDLGGHSLLMARVHARLKQELGVDLPLVRLFQYPTIESLVAHLEGAADAQAPAVTAQQQASKQRDAMRRLARRGRTSIA